ncbi:cation-transporting P-type ATPase [Candidatus Micrarchaeota archaeon]|nr:cation-transporting P-type ATPase [Candidatus Micrarchaeota archaeon]
MDYHALTVQQVLEKLNSSKSGLNEKEAGFRLKKYGLNLISGKYKRTIFDIILDQFKNFLLILLILAAIISFFIGHTLDAIAISFAVFLSIIFGFILEYKADESLRALKALQSPKAVVLRSNITKIIDASQIAQGDILILEEGAKIPADCRIIQAYSLEANEAALTGESASVHKSTSPVAKDSDIPERTNMLYSGTFITKGNAETTVVHTGDQTELGKIAIKLSDIESEETLLKKSLNDLAKKVSIISIIIILLFSLIGLFQNREPSELFILAVSLAVAAVPEGLITVLTIILSVGVKRMAENNALVRRLNVVENLGSATILVVDKTGTLTEGKMSLTKVFYSNKLYDVDQFHNNDLLSYASLCNTAKISEKGLIGDEMDKAILLAAKNKGIDITSLKKLEPILFKPFDSERKRVTCIFNHTTKQISIVKGAPELLFDLCSRIELNNKTSAFTKEHKEHILAELLNLTNKGMRVLAIAYKQIRSKSIKDAENDLIFLGLLAFEDPPRLQVRSTVDACRDANIRILMLTGDNLNTAISIGRQVDLLSKENEAIEWKSLAALSDGDLKRQLDTVKIIARSTPLSKLKIVEKLIEKGENVVVTGDGVNDALALKKAQVGVVMGSGTDVSKEAGSLVLLDDNLYTLITAVAYGRTVFNNIINFIRYQFTTNIAILLLFSLSFFLGFPYFLTPLQILFINLIMDGPPALALGLEKSSAGVLKQKPRRTASIISKNLLLSMFSSALFMAFITIAVYFYFKSDYPEVALAASFAVFVVLQLFNSLNCRFTSDHFFTDLKSNPYIILAVISMFLLMLPFLYIPELQMIFSTSPLSFQQFLIILGAASTVLIFEEIKKLLFKKVISY